MTQAKVPEARMRVELLRLQLGNIGASVIPTLLVALLLLWVLSNEENALAMRAWCTVIVVLKLLIAWDARRLLARDIEPEQVPALLRRWALRRRVAGVRCFGSASTCGRARAGW